MVGLICSVCGQLPGCWSGGSGTGFVKQSISAQVRLYDLDTFECRVGLSSFEVPGQLIRQDIFSRGQAECCFVGPDLPNLRDSGPGV